MEIMKCESCSQELTSEMEIEYSESLTSYFCHPNCAMDYYFNEMQSTPFDVKDKVDELEEYGIEIIDGKLHMK